MGLECRFLPLHCSQCRGVYLHQDEVRSELHVKIYEGRQDIQVRCRYIITICILLLSQGV